MPQAYTGPGSPDFTALFNNMWSAGGEWSSVGCPPWTYATNLVFGANPPYYLDDFLSFSPKFFGPATAFANSAVITGSSTVTVPSVTGLMMGQFVQCPGLPSGSLITGVTGSTSITVNTVATATLSGVTLVAYLTPVVPVAVIQLYVNLASASLVQARWQDSWLLGMAWFIAHYVTLFVETDSAALSTAWQTIVHGEVPAGVAGQPVYTLSAQPPGDALQALTNNGAFLTPGVDYTLSGGVITLTVATVNDHLYATWPIQSQTQVVVPATAAQIAAQGIATGIMTSKSVGDVSASYAQLTVLEDWGSFGLTKYGQQFASMARIMGAGPACFR